MIDPEQGRTSPSPIPTTSARALVGFTPEGELCSEYVIGVDDLGSGAKVKVDDVTSWVVGSVGIVIVEGRARLGRVIRVGDDGVTFSFRGTDPALH